ncbi:MAG: cellulase family glycosylhydrolase [Sphingobacteriales bacterium]|nr:cellulase family glycosylhydrolase [Sphingobacteriales bacterium]
MKKLFYLICFITLFSSCIPIGGGGTPTPNNPTITVKGKHIIAPCGDTLVPKGVNYAVYGWGWNTSENLFPEIAKSGANCVRIVWYKNNSAPAYSNLTLLDSALSRCIQQKMIPMLELHDVTCNNDTTAIINTANWFTQTNVKTILLKYQKWLMLNPVNEAGYVMWNSNNETRFRLMYQSIISNLRNAGLNMPLVLDASDCGQHLNLWKSIGTSLQNFDPKHNLIFSAHTYWTSYANSTTAITNLLNDAATWNIPVVLGEIANKQDDNTGNCIYTLDVAAVMQAAHNNNIGYLAWVWTQDNCGARQMTTNGNSNTLTGYGNTIINTATTGIKYAKKPRCW